MLTVYTMWVSLGWYLYTHNKGGNKMIIINKYVWIVTNEDNIIMFVRNTKRQACLDVVNKDGWNVEKHEVTI